MADARLSQIVVGQIQSLKANNQLRKDLGRNFSPGSFLMEPIIRGGIADAAPETGVFHVMAEGIHDHKPKTIY